MRWIWAAGVGSSMVAMVGCEPATLPPSSPASPPVPMVGAPPAPAAGPGLLVEPVTGIGLFRDEALVAGQQLARWAVSHGYRVVPVEKAEARFDAARRGLDHLGQRCGRPLPRFLAKRRYAAELGARGRLWSRVSCDNGGKTCTLRVGMTDDVGWDGKTVARFRAPYDPSVDWRTALTRAIAALAPSTGDEKGGLGLLGGMATGKVKARAERFAFSARVAGMGATSDDFKTALTFADNNVALRACVGHRHGPELLVEVDGAGRVTRCESRNADDETALCACSVFLGGAQGAPPVRGRRAFVGVSYRAADVVTPSDLVVSVSVQTHLEKYTSPSGETRFRPLVSDRSIDAWRPPNDGDLAPCFSKRTNEGKLTALIEVTFDATGHATRVSFAPGESSLTDHESVCVLAAFRQSVAPCPAAPQTTARAGVRVTLRQNGSDLPGLKDVLESK